MVLKRFWSLFLAVIMGLASGVPICAAQEIEPEEEDEDETTAVPYQQAGGGVVYTPFIVGALMIGGSIGFIAAQEDSEGDSPFRLTSTTADPEPADTPSRRSGGGGDVGVTVFILSGLYVSENTLRTQCSTAGVALNSSISINAPAVGAVSGGMSTVGSTEPPGFDTCGTGSGGGATVNATDATVNFSGVFGDFFNGGSVSYNSGDTVDIGNDARVINSFIIDGERYVLGGPIEIAP